MNEHPLAEAFPLHKTSVKQVRNKLGNPDIAEIGIPTQWKPNESGNPNGRPITSVTTLLKNASDDDKKKIATQLTGKAKRGDLKAIDMFIDRTDGKVQGDAPMQDNRVFNLYISEKGAKARALIKEVTKDATE